MTEQSGSVVVVTGAAAGIGRAVVNRCLTDGLGVVGIDTSPDPAPEERPLGRYLHLRGDVSDWSVHEAAVELASQLGQLTGWVNNAGIDVPTSAESVVRPALEKQLAVNLGGTVAGCRAAVRAFLASKTAGAIVNVSSVQAVRGFPASLAYEASKGAVEAVTRQIAVQYGPRGIRCNAVRPGVVMTPMSLEDLDEATDPELILEGWDLLSPLGRSSRPEETASAIAFLLSLDSSFMTGASLDVDGGLSIRGCLPHELDWAPGRLHRLKPRSNASGDAKALT